VYGETPTTNYNANNMIKTLLAFMALIVGPFLIAIAYATNFQSFWIENSVVLIGVGLIVWGALYLFIKFMRWLTNS